MADFLHASTVGRNDRLGKIGDFIRRDVDAPASMRELAISWMNEYSTENGQSPKMASDAINDVLRGIEHTYCIAPATLQRFANGATKRPNSQVLALLVVFVLQVRDGGLQKG